MTDFVLIHSPLVGPSSMEPTAATLEAQGIRCIVPRIETSLDRLPRWRDWPSALLEEMPSTTRPILVGHSMAGLLAARLASEMNAAGVICLDANIPPEAGQSPAVHGEFHQFLKGLPLKNGRLPKWNLWWGADLLEGISVSQAYKDTFVEELPEFELDWFDDAFDMPDWSTAQKGFVRTSPVFVEEANNAEALGWAVVRLKGTHLHPALEPEETANALLECSALMGLG